MLINQIGTNFQKGEPINNDLIMEIKRDINKQKKLDKVNVWKELLDFWPLSIVVPIMLLSILWGAYGPLVLQKKIGEVKENCMY